jgi:hyperosmotically inducible protein
MAKAKKLRLTPLEAPYQTSKTKENIVKITSVNTGKALKIFCLILSLSAMSLLLGVTGCSTPPPPPAPIESGHQQSAGQKTDDQNTSTRVNAALAQDIEYKFDRVNVETFNGTVQLSGFVSSIDQKNRAGDIAEKVEGAKQVRDNITVQVSGN